MAWVKSSETSGNDIGIEVDGDRSQVQQCNSHDNISIGIAALGDHCLITRNFANGNGGSGIAAFGNKCTVSFNTANSNGVEGIDAGVASGGTRHLVTGNTAINNADVDFAIACPSDVTNNRSSGGPITSSAPAVTSSTTADPLRLGARREAGERPCLAPGTVAPYTKRSGAINV